MKTTRGFTLIELLVVITIIGVLASIVLASLGASKGRGSDTALKADLATIQVQATLYYGIGNTYGATDAIGNSGACTTGGIGVNATVFKDTNTSIDDAIGNAILAAQKDASGGATGLYCGSASNWFLVAGKIANGHYWCVDSIGTQLEKTVAPGSSATSCNY